MTGIALLFLLTLNQAPSVQVMTLAGEQRQGTLESLTSDAVTVNEGSKPVSIPLSDVLSVQATNQPINTAAELSIEITLVDSTRLRVKSFVTSGSSATAVHPELGELRIPVTSIANVRLVAADPKIDGEWKQLVERPLKKDAVAVRKGDVLDHLDGVIGALTETNMQFQLDGDDIVVKREKIFGLVFSKRESTVKKAIAQFQLTSGDRLAVKQIARAESRWKAKLVSGLDLDIDEKLFHALDFSLGKVAYLSDMEPRNVKLTPYFDIPISFSSIEYRRDKNFDGGRITLGEKAFVKGLAIHSHTQMKYRLGGDFRRFQAVMGIGDEVPYGDVDVTIKGDGKQLFKAVVKAIEQDDKGIVKRLPPQALDLDVGGVVEIELVVGYGSDGRDIGDRLYLGNARFTK